MKKILYLLLSAALITGCFSACTSGAKSNDSTAAEGDASKKIKIVTTIFPEYDWVINVLGKDAESAEVTMLLDKEVDFHSYQPTVEDILKISNCDLFIYVGGESDEWAKDALKEAINKNMKVLNLLDILGESVKEEEMIEGMQETEHDEDHDDHEDEPENEEIEYDEHVWLSLKNAEKIVNSIRDSLIQLDTAHSDKYTANAKNYTDKLKALDSRYREMVSEAPVKTLLFGDRFPFRYLVDDYGLSYYAAFTGCSAETEASFETITFLFKKIDELSLHAVMTIEGSDHKIAETIISNTQTKNQKILTLNSMQSITAKDILNGTSYLSLMENNLSVLKEALNKETPSEPTVLPDNEDRPIDLDITTLSSTMVYSEVFNMMNNPDDYLGKNVKMKGLFSVYHDEAADKNYYACIIQDATACCSQGIEFELKGNYTYPDDYPEKGEEICVSGIFDTYMDGEYLYCTLRNAKFET